MSKREIAPIAQKSLGRAEGMKLVQKLEGSGWAMVGFQMDGKGFSRTSKRRVRAEDQRPSILGCFANRTQDLLLQRAC
jgi:hypothetical protein